MFASGKVTGALKSLEAVLVLLLVKAMEGPDEGAEAVETVLHLREESGHGSSIGVVGIAFGMTGLCLTLVAHESSNGSQNVPC